MNRSKNSVPAFDCLRTARKDWMSIYPMLEEANAEAAGYFLQQSLEYYLMAFLLQNGWKLRKIHELNSLLEDAVEKLGNFTLNRSNFRSNEKTGVE